MTSRFYRLPSLNALATFEASVRHRSFKAAAEELNVTPGAVSRQVRSLEEEVGTPLFHRLPTGLVPTAQGLRLQSVLSDAFLRTAETLDAIRPQRRQQQATLACTHALAKCWLMPRMTEFWRLHPEICLNHYISDGGRDVRQNEADLRIRYGLGVWPGEASSFLFDDILYPVASPAFLDRHPACEVADLPALPLLHVDWVDPDWTGWDQLLRVAGVTHPNLTGRRFGNFEIALQACRDEQGVAIGWDRLVRDQVAAGDLVRITNFQMPAPGHYYLCWAMDTTLSAAAEVVRDWLLDAAATDQQTIAATGPE